MGLFLRLYRFFLILFLFLVSLQSVFAASDDEAVAAAVVLVVLVIFVITLLLVAVAGMAFMIWMFVDCIIRDDFKGDNDKVIWIVVILLAGLIGAVVYYFVVKRELDRHKVPIKAVARKH